MNQHPAYTGDLERLQESVNARNVDTVVNGLNTALTYACRGGHPHVIRWLLSIGANPNLVLVHSLAVFPECSPLLLTAMNNHVICAQLLIEAGADPRIVSGYCRAIPLHSAFCSVECSALLIRAYPAGIHVKDRRGYIPLHYAAEYGALDVCKMLLDAGSVVDARSEFDHTSLKTALINDQRAVTKLLLEYGAQMSNVNMKPIPHWAVVFVECRDACRETSRALLELARRRSPVIGGNNRDVLGLIAKIVWHSRYDESWVTSRPRKVKRCNK